MHEIAIALVILFWIGAGIFRFFRWISRSLRNAAATPSPIQQAINEAQQQAQTAPRSPSTPPQMPRPQMPRQTATSAAYPRQPQAGGPVVLRETTSQDFQRQERELLTEEPTALGVPLQSPRTSPSSAPAFQLIPTNDDLVRALILQEVLAPPLSKRGHAG